MKKLVFTLILISGFFNVSAQLITNYSLGSGYNYFKSVPKSVFIADIGLSSQGSLGSTRMKGNPWFLRNLYNDQLKDSHSLLILLKNRNPDLAQQYEKQLDILSEIFKNGKKIGGEYSTLYEPVFPVVASDNPQLFHKCSTSLTNILEIYSEYYKDLHNANIELEIEQSKLNESYQHQIDSIIVVNKQILTTDQLKVQEELDDLEQEYSTFQKKYEKLAKPVANQYYLAIDLLRKEKKSKIDQLPSANFISNKNSLTQKYDNLIAQKTKQGNKELADLAAKFSHDNEQTTDALNTRINNLKIKNNELNAKLSDVRSNLVQPLPTQPLVDETKYAEKVDRIKSATDEKLRSIRF